MIAESFERNVENCGEKENYSPSLEAKSPSKLLKMAIGVRNCLSERKFSQNVKMRKMDKSRHTISRANQAVFCALDFQAVD